MASKRSKAVKNAFAERLQAEAMVHKGPPPVIGPLGVHRGPPATAVPLKGEWTKDTAVIPQNMRNDPLSVFVNTMNLWGLMATGWCAIARASWGLD
jgi:hypothetical protein